MSETGEKTKNCLEMVFMTKDQKECVFKWLVHKNRVIKKVRFITKVPNTQQKPLLEENWFLIKVVQKRFKSNLLKSKKYDQTAQKPKIGEKRQKLLKVRFSRSGKGKHCYDQAAKKKVFIIKNVFWLNSSKTV